MSRILNANGKRIPGKEEEAVHKLVQEDLAAFGEWQRAARDGAGLSQASLDAIGRSCLLSVFISLPMGVDSLMLQESMNTLLREARAEAAKKVEAAQQIASVGEQVRTITEDAQKGPTAGEVVQRGDKTRH